MHSVLAIVILQPASVIHMFSWLRSSNARGQTSQGRQSRYPRRTTSTQNLVGGNNPGGAIELRGRSLNRTSNGTNGSQRTTAASSPAASSQRSTLISQNRVPAVVTQPPSIHIRMTRQPSPDTRSRSRSGSRQRLPAQNAPEAQTSAERRQACLICGTMIGGTALVFGGCYGLYHCYCDAV